MATTTLLANRNLQPLFLVDVPNSTALSMEKNLNPSHVQTQLLHWKQEPDAAFSGFNQVSLHYDVSFTPATEQAKFFRVEVTTEVLNQQRGLVFQTRSQTLFQLAEAVAPPEMTKMFDWVMSAYREFQKQFEEAKKNTVLAGFCLEAPQLQDVQAELKRALQLGFGAPL